jgi:thiol-disulfide isomerase/thioredoxin
MNFKSVLVTVILGVVGISCLHAAPAAAPSEADKAYQTILDLINERPPQGVSQEDEDTWRNVVELKKADRCERFMRRFPADRRYAKVAIIFDTAALVLKGKGDQLELLDQEFVAKAVANSTGEDWGMIKVRQIQRMILAHGRASDKAKDLAAIRTEIGVLTKRAPAANQRGYLEFLLVDVLANEDMPAADALMRELMASSNKAVAKEAADRIKAAKAREKPVELQFVALDGTQVDLKKMRGKVVLVDFWATWCGPCVAALPSLKSLYEKYLGQGCVVVGVSLDKKGDRKKLEAFVKARKLAWPQYLDETNEHNRIAEEYGISGIPRALLFNKKGLLAEDMASGEKLEEMVKRLLAEGASKASAGGQAKS